MAPYRFWYQRSTQKVNFSKEGYKHKNINIGHHHTSFFFFFKKLSIDLCFGSCTVMLLRFCDAVALLIVPCRNLTTFFIAVEVPFSRKSSIRANLKENMYLTEYHSNHKWGNLKNHYYLNW